MLKCEMKLPEIIEYETIYFKMSTKGINKTFNFYFYLFHFWTPQLRPARLSAQLPCMVVTAMDSTGLESILKVTAQ
jgi:hypothetical protein